MGKLKSKEKMLVDVFAQEYAEKAARAMQILMEREPFYIRRLWSGDYQVWVVEAGGKLGEDPTLVDAILKLER